MLFGWSGHSRSAERAPGLPGPLGGVNWQAALVWYMRALAIAWLLKGLMSWALLLGVIGAPPSFAARPLAFQTATVFFALVDLIAGVGLWMAAGWGGGVWLIAIGAHVALGYLIPRAATVDQITLGIYGVLVALFAFMVWAALPHRES